MNLFNKMTNNISFELEQKTANNKPNETDSYFVNDSLYINTLKQLDIKKDAGIKLPTNVLHFCYKLESMFYEIVETLVGIQKFLASRQHLYEVINSEGLIRFYMDLDPPDKPKAKKFSYKDIVKLCEHFINKIKTDYYLENIKITYNIHISLTDEELQNNTYLVNVPYFTSAHIIFNIMTGDVNQVKYVMNSFKLTNYPLTEYIDMAVYSYRKKFRTVNQKKEQQKNKPQVNNKKLQKFVLDPSGKTNNLFHDPNVYETDFVSVLAPLNDLDFTTYTLDSGKIIYTDNLDLYIDVIIESPVVDLNTNEFNLQYNINQDAKLTKVINKLCPDDLTNRFYWINYLNLIITVIIMSGTPWNELLQHPQIINFLTKSKVGKYDTEEYKQSNIDLIKNKINKRELHQHYQNDFIEPLKKKEIAFIYKKLDLSVDKLIRITSFKANDKDEYIELNYDFMTTNDESLSFKTSTYIQKNRILLINSEKTEVVINKKLQQKVYSPTQYQLELETIMENTYDSNYTDIENCDYFIKNVGTLQETHESSYDNTYICASVGAGKSYHCLRKDTISILNQSYNTKILKITDGVIIAEKAYVDTIQTIIDAQKNNEITRHTPTVAIYNKLKPSTDYDEIDILICCIDSIEKYKAFKPTHLMIDEFNNVNKRLSSTKKIANEKDKLRDYYFWLCNNCVLKLYDADIDHNILSIFKQMLNVKMTIYKLIGFKQQNNTIVLNNYAETRKNIMNDLRQGRNITVSSSNAVDFLKVLCDEMYETCNITGVLITSQGALEFGSTKNPCKKLKRVLSKDTTQWKNYNAIVHSSAITCGVSFDDRTHFYKHYHISQVKTCDATQNAQMIYRVRGNITNTIEVCFINNQLTTLKNISVEDMLKRRLINFSTFTNNVLNDTKTNLLSIKQDLCGNKKHRFTIDKSISILANLQNIEELRTNLHNVKFVYEFFRTVYNYGSTNLICNFYSKYYNEDDEAITTPNEATINSRIRNDTVNANTLMIQKTYNAFNNAVVLEKIPDRINPDDNNEDEYNITKSFFYKKYNIPEYSWRYYNIILNCSVLITDSTINNFPKIRELLKPYTGFNFPECDHIMKLCDKYNIRYDYQEDPANVIYNNIEVVNTAIQQQKDIDDLLFYLRKVDVPKYTNSPIADETDEQLNNRVVDAVIKNPLLHTIDKAVGFYDNEIYPHFDVSIYNHINHFYNITNVAYFQVKHVIYDIFDNLLTNHVDVSLIDIQRNGVKKNDYLYFIEFIYGLYICFNIFDMLKIDFNDLSLLYLNEEPIQTEEKKAEHINGIIFEKALYQKQINQLIDKTDVYFKYILNEENTEKYKKDLQNRQALNYAFNKLNLTIELGEVRTKTGIITLNKSSFKYRTQQIKLPIINFYDISKDDLRRELNNLKINIPKTTDLTQIINNNILDDVIFYIPQEKTYGGLRYIKQVSYPKILLYNPESYREHSVNFIANNKNANTDYLHYGINLCCNNIESLLTKLNATDDMLKTTIYYNPLKNSTNIVNVVDALKQMKEDKTEKNNKAQQEKLAKDAEKEAEKQAKKEAKEAEKQAEKEAKEAEKQAKKEAKEAEKQAEKEAKEAEKEAEKQAKKEANALKQKEKDASKNICENCGLEYTLKNPKRHIIKSPECEGKMKKNK